VELLVNTAPKEEGARTVKLKPIPTAEYRRLEYDRWVKEMEDLTARLSGGKLGYLHLSAMNDENLEKYKRAVFGDMQEKQGLVLDVRFNGGGSIADEILAIMQDRVFSWRTMRGDPNRLAAPLRVWTKPTTVLINEASFSNAEAFPWGVKALKLGRVVGVPTYGAVIGTGGTTLIDGSSLRIPSTGAYTLDGINMENNGCPPDMLVEHSPKDVAENQDRQLERAVEALMRDLR
jgi:tricorn protease